jgi:hypothetical protein
MPDLYDEVLCIARFFDHFCAKFLACWLPCIICYVFATVHVHCIAHLSVDHFRTDLDDWWTPTLTYHAHRHAIGQTYDLDVAIWTVLRAWDGGGSVALTLQSRRQAGRHWSCLRGYRVGL